MVNPNCGLDPKPSMQFPPASRSRTRFFASGFLPVLWWALVLSAIVSSGQAGAASLEAEVRKQTVVDGETVLLYIIGEDLRAYPDTTELNRRFDIVGSRRQQSQFVDGGVVKSRYTMLLELLPKHLGVSDIPSFEADGQRSEKISIEVVARGTPGVVPRDNVFAELSVDTETPYVQAQAIVSLHVFDDGSLAAAEPEVPDIADMQIEPIPGDAQRLETRDGVEYRVHTWRYAVFPQRSGTYDIPRIKVVANVKDDAYGGNLILRNSPTRRINFRSDSIQLQVKPRPPQSSPDWWLPVKQLDLQKTWSASPTASQVGEPLTYSVELTTNGATSTQLPEIELPQVDGLKIYPDVPALASQAGDDGVISRRTEKWSIIPQRAGTITLPEYKLRWWDTVADRERTTTIPAQEIIVTGDAVDAAAPSTSIESGSANAAATEAAATGGTDADPSASDSVGISALVRDSAEQVSNSQASQLLPARRNFWAWVAAALSIGWMATLLSWLFSARRNRMRSKASTTIENEVSVSETRAMRDLTAVSGTEDRSRYLAGLLHWAGTKWPDNPPVSVVDVGRRLHDKALSAQLQQLESSIYSQRPTTMSLQSVHKALRDAISRNSKNAMTDSREPPVDELLPKL